MRESQRLARNFIKDLGPAWAAAAKDPAVQDALERWFWDIVRMTRYACASRARHGFSQLDVSQITQELLESTAQYIEEGDLNQEMDAASAAMHRMLLSLRTFMDDYQALLDAQSR